MSAGIWRGGFSCFNTQPPEGGCCRCCNSRLFRYVSTLSRPKAAAATDAPSEVIKGFQHSAARRRLFLSLKMGGYLICFNTQPPEGGCFRSLHSSFSISVSTLSRPKAAGLERPHAGVLTKVSTLSRPKAAGRMSHVFLAIRLFQHSAARRRLGGFPASFADSLCVSTLSRPKAAVCLLLLVRRRICGFNTQPPEGGCLSPRPSASQRVVSTLSRPKAAASARLSCFGATGFQHSAARRRLQETARHELTDRVSTLSRPKAAVPAQVQVLK